MQDSHMEDVAWWILKEAGPSDVDQITTNESKEKNIESMFDLDRSLLETHEERACLTFYRTPSLDLGCQ